MEDPYLPFVAESSQAEFDANCLHASIAAARETLSAAKVSYYLTKAGFPTDGIGTSERRTEVTRLRRYLDVLLKMDAARDGALPEPVDRPKAAPK
jgi:hypothetical protein